MAYQTALKRHEIEDTLLDRNASMRTTQAFGRAWETVQKDFGTAALTGLVMYLMQIIMYWMQSGIMIGLYEQNTLNKKFDIGAVFRGFEKGKEILFMTLIYFFASIFIFFVPYIVMIIALETQNEALAIPMAIIMFVGILVVIFFSNLAFIPIGLITFANYNMMDAIKTGIRIMFKFFGGVILYILFSFLINLLGLLLCGFGLLITVPMTYYASYYCFQNIFNLEEGQRDETDDIMEHLV